MQQIVWQGDVEEAERWTFNDIPFEVDGVEYVSTLQHRSKTSRLCIKKQPALVEATANLLADFRHSNIVELGISQGGSTALTAQLTQGPRKLVALELNSEPVTQLQDFIDRSGLGDVVRPYYGVDQSDRHRLRQILDDEFGDEPLDLVMDDASHLLDETRTSFEVLFPRLRPGGLFVIEDWNWQHLQAKSLQAAIDEQGSPTQIEFQNKLREALADPSSPESAAFNRFLEASGSDAPPSVPSLGATNLLTLLVIQLLLARASSNEVVSRLDILDLWVVVHRGRAELDPDTFRVADIAHDHFDVMGRLSRE